MYIIVYKTHLDGRIRNTITTMTVGKWLISMRRHYPDKKTILVSAHSISDSEYEELLHLGVQ